VIGDYSGGIAEILREAGELLSEGLKQDNRSFTRKNSIDLVTCWDTKIEQLLTRRLEELFPDHGIIGEEGGGSREGFRRCFIVDPIDGTTNFVHGFPFCCISIACVEGNAPIAGGVYAPALDKLFLAETGSGATCNGEPVSVSGISSCDEALFVTGFSYERRHQKERLLQIVGNGISSYQGVRRTGSAALDLCYVASGIFDFYLETGIHAWDIAAGALFVEEAGGRVSMLDGSPLDLFGRQIAAGNPAIFKEALKKTLEGLAV